MSLVQQVFFLLLTCVAAYGLQRFVTTDVFPGETLIRKPLSRLAFTVSKRNRAAKKPAPRQPWYWLLSLTSCPWCFGAWTAFAMVAGVDWWLRTHHGAGFDLPVLHALVARATVGWMGELEPDNDA